MKRGTNQTPGAQSKLDDFLAVKKNRWAVFGGLGLVELCLVAGILSVFFLSGKDLAFLPGANTLTPTPACLQPALTLGASSFQVLPIQRAADGSVTLPPNAPGSAFWVDGTSTSFVFGLSANASNTALKTSLKTGDSLRIIWADCSMDDFVVQSVQEGALDMKSLFDQSIQGMRVFVQNGAGPAGFVINGVRLEALAATQSPCDQCMLRIGKAQFKIKDLKPAADGTYTLPAGSAGVAFHYLRKGAGLIYSLSPTAANLALGKTIKAGDLLSITGPNCAVTTFTLSDPEIGGTYNPAVDLPEGQMVLFIHESPAGKGFILRGGPVQEEVIPTSTPAPDGPGIEAEIGLLETTTSADKATIRVRVSVRNYGSSVFNITADDVWVISENSAPIAAMNAEPALPMTIGPGVTQAFYFIFPRPTGKTAVLKILNVEYDLE